MVKMHISESGEEDYSLVFIGVQHEFPIHILVLEMTSNTVLRFLLNEYGRGKAVKCCCIDVYFHYCPGPVIQCLICHYSDLMSLCSFHKDVVLMAAI